MKIMLFWDGQRGVVIKLPGARPLEEIGELLGGAGLPTRYELHRLGRAPEPVAGDCAVAASSVWSIRDQHMKLCFAMIGCAGQAVFLPDFTDSPRALFELQYCRYIKKPVIFLAEKGDEPPERAEEETAFLEETDRTAKVREVEVPREGNAAWSGFLFLRCPVCGRKHAFCAKTPLGE